MMPGMSTTRDYLVFERAPFAAVDPKGINREAGYIDGVLICGGTSRNGREYPTEVFRRDFAKYEGVHVRCDHDDNRVTDKKIGWFSGVYVDADGRPRGRLNLLKSHPMTERVFEAAERNPSLYGMSHVAVCGTKRVNGRERVESLNQARSIDLVDDPATLKSLYTESFFQPKVPPVDELAEATAKLTAAQTELTAMKEQLAAVTAERDGLLKESTSLKLDKFLADSGLVQVTESERKAVGLLSDEADRKALVESLKKGRIAANAQTPKSGEQNGVKAGTATTGGIPTDGKAFAESLKRAK